MEPIREQLGEQARAIRDAWAWIPNAAGYPRCETIMLGFESPVPPAGAMFAACGRVNSGPTYAPTGCLLWRGWESERAATMADGGITVVHKVTLFLSYREAPWNHRVLVATATSLAGGPPKVLIDDSAPPVFRSIDFDALLDALGPPATGSAGPAADPGPGSWRDRPPLL